MFGLLLLLADSFVGLALGALLGLARQVCPLGGLRLGSGSARCRRLGLAHLQFGGALRRQRLGLAVAGVQLFLLDLALDRLALVLDPLRFLDRLAVLGADIVEAAVDQELLVALLGGALVGPVGLFLARRAVALESGCLLQAPLPVGLLPGIARCIGRPHGNRGGEHGKAEDKGETGSGGHGTGVDEGGVRGF